MNKIKRWLIGTIGIFTLIVSTYIAQIYTAAQKAGETPHYFGPTENQQKTWLSLTLVILIMLTGVICNYLFEKAKTISGDKINVSVEFRKMFSNPKFIMALVIAPLTFNSIYMVIGDNPSSIGDYLLAFQNGFFWQSIVSAAITTHEVEETAPSKNTKKKITENS